MPRQALSQSICKPAAARRIEAGYCAKVAENDMKYSKHDDDYPPENLAGILNSIKSVAMVDASTDPTEFS